MKVHIYAIGMMVLLIATLALASATANGIDVTQPCFVGSKFTAKAFARDVFVYHRPSLLYSQSESSLADKLKDKDEPMEAEREFFITDAQFVRK